LDDSFA